MQFRRVAHVNYHQRSHVTSPLPLIKARKSMPGSNRTPRGSGRDRTGLPTDDINDNANVVEEEDEEEVPGLVEIPSSRPSGAPQRGSFPDVIPIGVFGSGPGGMQFGPGIEFTMENGQVGMRVNMGGPIGSVPGGQGQGGGPRGMMMGFPPSDFPPLPGRGLQVPNPLAMLFQHMMRGVGGGGGSGGPMDGAGMEEMISQLAAQIFASGEGVDEPADESFIASLKHEPVTEADVAAQKACSVCLVEFSLEDTNVCKLACTHGFHIDCLKPWLARAHTCPVCRLELRAAQASASSESSGSSGSSGPSNPERVSGRSRGRPRPEPRGDPGDQGEGEAADEEEDGSSRQRPRRIRAQRGGRGGGEEGRGGLPIDPSDLLRMLFSGSSRPGGMTSMPVDDEGFFQDDMEAALRQSMADASAHQQGNSAGAGGGSTSSGAPSSSTVPSQDIDTDIGRAFLDSLEIMTIEDIKAICQAEGVAVSPSSTRFTLIEGLAQKQGITLPRGWSGGGPAQL